MKQFVLFLIALAFCVNGMEITRDGKAVADIAIPENAVTSVRFAAQEFQKFVKVMSGATLEIVPETAPRKIANRVFIGCGAPPQNKAVFAWHCKADDSSLYLHGNDKEVFASEKGEFRKALREWRVESSGTLLAVYDFADRELGIYFVRPGDAGIVAPVQKSITIKPFEREDKPRWESVSMGLSNPNPKDGGWKDFEYAQNFINDCRVWMLRHRMVNTYWFPDGGHSFTTYWTRFSKSHPEYFALLVDGTRRPLPGNESDGRHIPMCISNSGLQDQLVSDWRKKKSRWHDGYYNYISACENDVPGMCTCDKCRSWDGPLFDPTNAPYWGDKKIPSSGERFTALGIYAVEPDIKQSLTDRYCHFYREVLKKARKFNPNVKVYGYAYGNYGLPPQEVKLDENYVISYVSTPLYPMDEKRMAGSKERWEGWCKVGCLLEYRPNATWAYGCMPLQYTRQLCGEYKTALNSPQLQQVFFDYLRCEFANQGLMYYTLGRLTLHPEMTLEQIADEFFAIFGAAEPEVRQYYDYWTKVSDAVTWNDVKKWEAYSGLPLNIFTCGDFCADTFKLDAFTESAKILEAAAKKADTDRAKKEVAFLQVGLQHAYLAQKMQLARLNNVSNPSPEAKLAFDKAMQELTSFRNAHEKLGISDMGKLCFYERYGFRKSKPIKK